jgi:hypothetical protein
MPRGSQLHRGSQDWLPRRLSDNSGEGVVYLGFLCSMGLLWVFNMSSRVCHRSSGASRVIPMFYNTSRGRHRSSGGSRVLQGSSIGSRVRHGSSVQGGKGKGDSGTG